MDELETSHVYKCIEKKTLILGFELPDLLALCFLLCALNLAFANSPLKIVFAWGPVAAAAVVLRVAKRGKPDGYLVHLARYHLTPGVYRAFPSAEDANGLFEMKSKSRRLYAELASRFAP